MEKIEKLNQDFQTQVLTRLAVIESKIDDYKNLQQKCNEAYSLSINNRERINKIEDTLKWIWRTVAGILIAGIMAIVFKFGG